MRALLALLVLLTAFAGCATTNSPALTLKVVATGLAAPLYATSPKNDPRLFVVEQAGRVRIVKNGQLLTAPFLDVSSLISYGGERGLLGLAFHPAYGSNGRFYVNYTDTNGDTRVVQYTVSANPDAADPGTAKLIFTAPQPYANHNGGMVLFGPDGMLYIGMGDGGSGGDPQGNGQNENTLLGKMLRLDVDGGDPYAIPPSNPFAGVAGKKQEIWAKGLRNPWRFSFDQATGLLYIGDVGQNAWEEIDVVPAASAGLNFGWNTMEGKHCYGSASCSSAGLTLPVVEYSHGQGCSVAGGYVYRGSAIPGLVGTYFYGDYCGGWVRSFKYAAGSVTEEQDWNVGSIGRILSFGEDAAGELYVLSDNGRVYRITGP